MLCVCIHALVLLVARLVGASFNRTQHFVAQPDGVFPSYTSAETYSLLAQMRVSFYPARPTPTPKQKHKNHTLPPKRCVKVLPCKKRVRLFIVSLVPHLTVNVIFLGLPSALTLITLHYTLLWNHGSSRVAA